MNEFLQPSAGLESVFSLFAMSASYADDVIDKRGEMDCVAEVYEQDQDSKKAALNVLNSILSAPELAPLSKTEISQVLLSIQRFHAEAYHWTPNVSEESLSMASQAGGYLLRTKIRAAIELLDQLYQYGEAGDIKLNELGSEHLEEEAPELELEGI